MKKSVKAQCQQLVSHLVHPFIRRWFEDIKHGGQGKIFEVKNVAYLLCIETDHFELICNKSMSKPLR